MGAGLAQGGQSYLEKRISTEPRDNLLKKTRGLLTILSSAKPDRRFVRKSIAILKNFL
jgi:hypothetical protein